jgi:hypothetical protein
LAAAVASQHTPPTPRRTRCHTPRVPRTHTPPPRAQFAGRDAPSTVISFAQKSLKDGAVVSKLHVIELGSVPGAGVSSAARARAHVARAPWR